MTRLALALLATLLAACQTAPAQLAPRRAVFVEAEYAPFAGTGSSSIEGQAFMRTRGGGVRYGAGCTVACNPATSYSTEWYERHVLGGERLAAHDRRTEPYLRTTVADAEGRFRFDGLPPGDYYLACQIVWDAGMMMTGGWACAKASVADGQVARVVVTR